ncbi:unnamed protein product, partial [Effrenium voratum]
AHLKHSLSLPPKMEPGASASVWERFLTAERPKGDSWVLGDFNLNPTGLPRRGVPHNCADKKGSEGVRRAMSEEPVLLSSRESAQAGARRRSKTPLMGYGQAHQGDENQPEAGDMPRRRRCGDGILRGACVAACAAGSAWEAAVATLRAMPGDVIACSSAITACERARQWEAALRVLSQMRREVVQPNEITYNALMSACQKGGRWQHALALFAEMEEQSIRRTVVSYGAAISASDWERALHFLGEMPGSALLPNSIIYSSAMQSLVASEQWQLALVLWSSCEVQAQDAALLCSAMGAWAVVGRWDQALGLLQELRGRSAADGVAETCAIRAAEASARWELALEILAGGRNPVTGGSCLAVLARAAQWQRALQLLKDLPADAVAYGHLADGAKFGGSGWAPDAFSFSAGISACGQGRLWQRALVLLRESQASEARDASDVKGGVSLVPLSAAISACGAARQWRWVLQLLEEMCADRVSPNTVTYTSAIASTDRWEAVLALLAEMELRAVDAGVVALASAADTLARPGPLGGLLKRAEATALRLLAPEKRVGPASADVGMAVDVGPPEPMLQAVMALAAAFLYLSGFTLFIMGRRDSTRAFTTIAVLNTLIAGSAYLGMSQGLFINMVDGRRVFCLRYADWIFSTALCLLDLALMRGASMKNTLLLVSLDVLMIMLVACAATTAWSAGKWQYYGAAVMCFIAVMSILYHVLTTAAEVKGSTDGVDAQRKFKFV